MARKGPRTCIIPKCERPQAVRGLCQSCYRQAMRAIERGKETDKGLIERKLLLPKAQKKYKPRSPFSISLANRQ